MPDSRDGQPPGNVVWLGRDMHFWIARELTGWWEDLLDRDIPDHLLKIIEAAPPSPRNRPIRPS